MGERRDAARQQALPDGRPFSAPFRARYRVVGLLGRGGMGEVWRAVQKELGREVAVKFTAATTESERARFLREGALQASLKHPNVLQVYDAGEEQGRLYLVFEIVDGESLAARIARQGALPLESALEVARQTCAALAHVHDRGILHRDLKSDNILLTKEGIAKVCDFGLAIQAEGGRRLTQYGVVMGTPGYLAPELARGTAASAASDLYAFGCVFFEMLTGQVPYPLCEPDGTERNLADVVAAHVNAPVPSASALRPELPESVDEILQRCLQKSPERRFASAAELAAALEQTAREAAQSERGRGHASRAPTQHIRSDPSPGQTAGRATTMAQVRPGVRGSDKGSRGSRRWLALGGGLAVALLVALTGWAALRRDGGPAGPAQVEGKTAPLAVTPAAPRSPAAAARPKLELFAGASSIRVAWTPTSPAPVLLRYGQPGRMTARAQVPPGRAWAELGGLEQMTAYAVEPRWPDGSTGPLSTTTTLVRVLEGIQVQPGIWRSGRASWESFGRTIRFFSDVANGRPLTYRQSEDGGSTWSGLRQLPFAFQGATPRTASQGERLWLARTGAGARQTELLLTSSPDGGRSWQAIRALRNEPGDGLGALLPDGPDLDLFLVRGGQVVHARVPARAQDLLSCEPIGDFGVESWPGAARTDDGVIHVLGRSSRPPRQLLYARLLTGRRGWQPAVPFPGGKTDADGPVLAVSGRRIYALWLDPAAKQEAPVLVFSRSRDAGQSWSAPRRLTETSFIPTIEEEGATRYALVADGDVVAAAFQDDVGLLSSRVRVIRSLDGGESFKEYASARINAGKVMGVSLLTLPDSMVYGMFLASLEVYGVVRFPPLLPAGTASAGRGPSTRIH